ncbi:MAG TPA: protein-methionine-sulfoxide reductase catalytic subunit MsrP [Beijerinckiaceae bacterium]|nr:protein-methionine-sulfoxide reductase catalytic subunit MsrP [Rhodoblastus sp.]HRY02406.1 protein-methionine-sulfoxide reductase catalytic subunit MsrP [Beijerinckiaceae bacterium]
MLIKTARPWDIPESGATPEHLFFNRRALLAGAGAIGGALAAPRLARAAEDPSAALYPAPRNEAYKLDRAVTPEKVNAHYNNFYEFGMSKNIADAAAALKTRPWSVKIDGLCNAPQEIAIDDLIKRMQIEERLYRHRCVEAWSMTIPWTGFPLSKIVALADPKPEAKYVRFETFKDPKVAPGQRQIWYPWPYTEGVTVEEAKNDLAFMVTGAYGKPLLNQFGAPIRLALPWKYGFKSIKSIVRISFVAEKPKSYWEQLQGSEYGFWANVNPQVPHPRWSQATEEVIGTGNRVPTQLYNGYAEQVAGLYKSMPQDRALFF